MMEVTQEAIDLIKEFEGLRLKAYRDSAGVWTIGYGTTAAAGVGISPREGMTITEDEAEEYLWRAIEKFADQIEPYFQRPATDNQFGAFLSLAYNIGPSAFRKSTALKRFNAGDIEGAAEAMTWFNKAGGKVLRGLVRRREAERALFLSKSDSDAAVRPDEPRENPATSKTVQGGGAVAAIGAGGSIMAALGNLDPQVQMAVVVGGVVLIGLGLFIIRERLRHWAQGVR